MTPLEYLMRYYNLEVPVENAGGVTQWLKVKVACYRIGEDDRKSRETFLDKLRPHINEKGETIKVKVMSVYGEEEKVFKSKAEIAPFVAAPFYGKGTPEDVQIVLQLAVRYGLIGKTQGEIQAYCDDKDNDMGRIGLDCSGFVGNFLRHSIGGMMWDQKPAKGEGSWNNSGVPSLMKNVGTRIKTFEELLFHKVYILGLVNKDGKIINRPEKGKVGHVMISQPLTRMEKPVFIKGNFLGLRPSLQVLESTGKKGLVESRYDVLEVDKKGIFTVWRGSKQEEMRVQIYRVFGF